MLAVRLRSGLVETSHTGAVAVTGPDGELIASYGEIDRPFFLRSASKPFQAWVSQEMGAGLAPTALALASASHRGLPVHVALVEKMLNEADLDESALRCPPDWPLSSDEQARLLRSGHSTPRRIWHNCSGKHAGFLRACAAKGWSTIDYLDPAHPLQAAITTAVEELGGQATEPVGVDGCGAPVHQTTAQAMSRLFSRLGGDPELVDVFTAMHRYPALVSVNGQGESGIATAIDAAAKGGAAGCIGVAVAGGYGVAVKSWDGSHEIAVVGAIAALDQIGLLTENARRALVSFARPVVLGGGAPVGRLEPRLELEFL